MNKNIDQEKLQIIRDNGIRWYLLNYIGKDKEDTRSPFPTTVTNNIINYAKPELTPEMLAFLQSRITIPHTILKNAATAIAFNHDGTQIATGSDTSETIKIWNATNIKHIRTLTKKHSSLITSLAFTHDGTRLASGSWDKTIQLWDPLTGNHIQSLKNNDYVESIAFNHDDTLLASGSSNGIILLWKLLTSEWLQKFENQRRTPIIHILFNHDGTLLLKGFTILESLNLQTGTYITIWDDHEQATSNIAYNHNGLSAIGIKGQRHKHAIHDKYAKYAIRLWNPQTGDYIDTLKERNNYVASVRFNHNGTLLASGMNNGIIKLLDTTTGECVKTIIGHTDNIRSIVFNQNGTQFISTSRDNTTRIWNLQPFHQLPHKVQQNHTLEETVLLAKFATYGCNFPRTNMNHFLSISKIEKLKQMGFELT